MRIIFSLITSLVFSLVCFLVVFIKLPQYDQEETELFLKYKDDFDYVTNYLNENFDNDTSKAIRIERNRNGEVIAVTVGFTDVTLEESIKEKFKPLDEILNRKLEQISFTPERISYEYGDLLTTKYVYSRNGKTPNYFYHKGDGVNYISYYLGDNWYLLRDIAR